jgi:cytochrome c
MMKSKQMKIGAAIVAMAAATFFGGTTWAGETATAKEAEALVKKGISFIKANGKEKGYAEISNKKGQFVDRDLYLIVMRLDGTVVAHGTNAKLIGVNRIETKDIDGKEFMRERAELAKSKPSFWQDYKYTNPLTKKVEPKSAYCERVDDAVVCGGIYKL